jgi:polyhydroxyalkanoate synthesis repressor PhaR
MEAVRVIKKYSNRRLYDTEESRYITLEELAEAIRKGGDIQVVDAKTGEDLTQVTLAQIILESRRAASLLPVPLLTALIRMEEDALAEFFGQYVSWALGVYVQVKQGLATASPFGPLAGLQLPGSGVLGRIFGGGLPFGHGQPPAAPAPSSKGGDAVAELRRELDELKRVVSRKRRRS